MKQAVQGKKIIYLFRPMSDATTAMGKRIAFTKENGEKIDKDSDSTSTKDGNLNTSGTAEIEITVTSVLASDDEMIEDLREAMLNDELIEIWRVNLAEKASTGTNKFKGRYYQGLLTSMEESSPSDDFVEESLTFKINGVGAKGDVTVSDDMQEEASYTFKDSVQAAA